MEEQELQKRLDFIEFRQELLFDNSKFSRTLFHYKVTREQHDYLINLFEEYSNAIQKWEIVRSSKYEALVWQIVPHRKSDNLFVEFLAKSLHEDGRYEEVFEALYGKSAKFKHYLETK